jgi:hypothetical protein
LVQEEAVAVVAEEPVRVLVTAELPRKFGLIFSSRCATVRRSLRKMV